MTGDDKPDPYRAAEMTAHDALPEQVRRLLHDAPVHVPTEVVATCLRIGMKPARAVEVSVNAVMIYGTEGALACDLFNGGEVPDVEVLDDAPGVLLGAAGC